VTTAAGSPQAQGEVVRDLRTIFDAHYDYVWCSLRRLGVQERDLEDVTHDLFLTVNEKLTQLDPARPIKPWLFAFAVRMASDYRKLARNRSTELTSSPEMEAADNQEDALATKDTARLLHAALDELSMELRAVIVLYEIDETPMKEIAEALQIPVNTAYSRLRLAREQCAATITRLRKERKP
jgi:RNA polymerase sigma-70 factor (ECF subfamily)